MSKLAIKFWWVIWVTWRIINKNQTFYKIKIFQRKLDMIDQMVAESRKRRAQMASEETFEPIAIDFGFEDSVAFDSDKG